jgi:hypothetical protein
LPLWADLKEWQTAIHTVGSVLTLLLVVLLENASRRAEEASQEKLNVIAEALAELMASEPRNTCNVQDAAKPSTSRNGIEIWAPLRTRHSPRSPPPAPSLRRTHPHNPNSAQTAVERARPLPSATAASLNSLMSSDRI